VSASGFARTLACKNRGRHASVTAEGRTATVATIGPRSPAAGTVGLDTIFISIAAYRDPDLAPTLEDCLAKARWPERLRFGICWQHGPEEEPLPCFMDPAFRVIDVDWRESRGACWARAEVMALREQERWFLQLDAHHRFAQDWDQKLLAQAAATGSVKPILTTYLGPFDPEDEGSFAAEPMRMEFDRFTDDGIVLFRPGAIPGWEQGTGPLRSRFLSAHFLFAPGSFVADVPYDPDLYFLGEEITLAVRAFTHGYDLFHPGEVIAWHEYTRNYRRKHWDDHTAANDVAVEWSDRDGPSRQIASRLLTDPHQGLFGCGAERSVADYEAYAGISFAHRCIQDYTRHHREPPNPPAAADWVTAVRERTVSIVLAVSELGGAASDARFWYVGFHDADGEEIFRGDADRDELERVLGRADGVITITREFESAAVPVAWSLMPYSDLDGWLEPVEGNLVPDETGDLSGVTEAASAAMLEQGRATSLPPGADLSEWYPCALPDLDWVETDEGFVLNLGGARGFVANHTGVVVLELADGRHSVAEIVTAVADVFGLDEHPAKPVRAFLDIASSRALVELHRRKDPR